MKTLARTVATLTMISSVLGAAAPMAKAEEGKETTLIYLSDLEDEEIPSSQPSTEPSLPTPARRPKNLDEAIQIRKDLNDRQRRILKDVVGEQKEFVSLLNRFVAAEYSAANENASLEFVQIRDRIVELTFKAQDEKLYYERVYLINTLWLQNQSEAARFKSLDSALQDASLRLEEKRRRIRQIITGVTAVGGAVVIGYLSYVKVLKPVLMNPTESGISDILRIGGRGVLVLLGTGIGAMAGGYAGFLGSAYLQSRQREMIDPVNGSMDLNELLDMIDQMP